MPPTPDPPPPHRSAAVLSIGDELTLGQTLDTNSRWIATRLVQLGVHVREHATVSDDQGRIASAMRRLAASGDLLICTGGLGPTADDLTRPALAESLDETLIEDGAALDAIRAWFAGRGGMPESNRVQALRPPSARALENTNGTAPGLAARIGGTDVYCLPGPPHEMRPMFERFVTPGIRPEPGRITRSRLILTFGLGESRVAERLGELMDRTRGEAGVVLVGTTASLGVVTCRLRVSAPTPAEAATALDQTESEINRRLGDAVFDRRDPHAGDETETADALPRTIVRLLRERGERLAVVESCTGGLLGAEITSIPGSSAVFVGGWMTYSNGWKTAMVGVPPAVLESDGAVSEACAKAMAQGGLERARTAGGADHTLAITGIAGPEGGSPDKPVGTVWIARASKGGSIEARRFRFKGDRNAVRAWAARSALGMLRLHLAGLDMPLLAETR